MKWRCGLQPFHVKGTAAENFRVYSKEAFFIRSENRGLLLADSDPDSLLQQFSAYEPPAVTKWIDNSIKA